MEHYALGRSDALDRYGITPRERQIIELICVGKTNQEIMEGLFISLAIVKDHSGERWPHTQRRGMSGH